MINGAQCIAHLLRMLVCNMIPLIAASIWLSLAGLGVVAAMHTKLSMAKSMHAGFHVHSPPWLTMHTIFLSLFGIAMRLALHAVTDVHCALTMVIACICIAKIHWISACLLTLYAPACFQQMLQGLEAALQHAILALIRKPKRHVFAHPKTRYGSFWKRIRNRTCTMRRQMLYKYLKTLCKLLSCVRRLKIHERSTSAYDEEMQNSYGEEAQRTTYACTRADHGNKGCGTCYNCMHNCYPQKQHICKALNYGSAWHGTETMGCEHAPVRPDQSHALDKGEHDCHTGIRQNKQQKTQSVNMQPALSNAALISGQSETKHMQEKASKGARMFWGGRNKSEKQRQTEADNETYLPFSTTDEWLSNNHIMHCTLYLLHMHYPTATHQNMTGVTHSVVQRDELLFKIREGSGQVPKTSFSDIAGTLRKTLSRDGPCPAIVVGDGIHWRIILTDARSQTVAFIDPFGSGFLQDIVTAIKTFYDNERPGRWQYKEWTTRLQQRGDTWNCGVWAIWIQEKWMQYWSQNEVTSTFESWFQDNNRTIPAGQGLREHYHAVVQMANRVVQNSRTGFAISRSIAASRWQTNAQRPMELPDSPDNQARANGHAQAKKAATTRLHRTVGNSLSSLHTSMKTHRKIYKNQLQQIQQEQDAYCPGCKGVATAETQARCNTTLMKLACSKTQ